MAALTAIGRDMQCEVTATLIMGLALPLSLAVFSGCASAPGKAGRALGRYARARGQDLMDTFEVGVESGEGFDVKIHWGIGVWGGGKWENVKVMRIGSHTGRLYSYGHTTAPLPIPLIGPVVHLCTFYHIPVGPSSFWDFLNWTFADISREWEGPSPQPQDVTEPPRWEVLTFYSGPVGSPMDPRNESYHNKSFPLGFRLFLRYGIRFRIYPLEVVDAVAGFVGLDIVSHPTWPSDAKDGRQ